MNSTPLDSLGDLPLEDFFQRYWQREAVFCPAALGAFRSPLTPEELAGLALEEDIESRLITHRQQAPWQLEHGPFDAERFASLDGCTWTLLVQAVDHWLEPVAELLNQFRFIPNWRLDDIMVSYAPTGGSVGPHFDYYDVFLVQGAGTRQWQIGQHCDSDSPLLADTDLKILRDFHPRASHIAQPGDVLYIPPGCAHWGESLSDDCITYSVGFRAPSHADMLGDLSQDLASFLTEDTRFVDSLKAPASDPGLIDKDTLTQIQAALSRYLTENNLASWFGRYMTQPKYPELDQSCPKPLPEGDYRALLEKNIALRANGQSRFSYCQSSQNATLFVDGQQYHCSLPLARLLCAGQPLAMSTLDRTAGKSLRPLLRTLLGEERLIADE